MMGKICAQIIPIMVSLYIPRFMVSPSLSHLSLSRLSLYIYIYICRHGYDLGCGDSCALLPPAQASRGRPCAAIHGPCIQRMCTYTYTCIQCTCNYTHIYVYTHIYIYVYIYIYLYTSRSDLFESDWGGGGRGNPNNNSLDFSAA